MVPHLRRGFSVQQRLATCTCPPLPLADPRNAVVAGRRSFYRTERPELLRIGARVCRELRRGLPTGSDAASGVPRIPGFIVGYLNVLFAGPRPN